MANARVLGEADDIPEPDCTAGAPHPRMADQLFGHDGAERAVLEAHNLGRMHHAWLLCGPKGVGKATFAWRLARFLLATTTGGEGGLFGAPPPPDNLDIDPEHPIARRLRALSEPGLFLLRRPWDAKTKRLRGEITVEPTRALKSFFAQSAAEGGRRVVIIDAADEMNSSAANAVLKLLEEPPSGAILLLVCHQPSRLLPTIRSRCRNLRFGPLGPSDLAAALEQADASDLATDPAVLALSGGSVGAALRLGTGGGAEIYGGLIGLLRKAPGMDRSSARAWADMAASRQGDGHEIALDLVDLALVRLARRGAMPKPEPEAVEGEADALTRLCPDPSFARHWADLHQDLVARLRRAAALNLDPAALLLDTVLKIDAGAAEAGIGRV